MRYCAPIFNHIISIYFFRVGLCPTHVLPFAGDMDAWRTSDLIRTVEISWTRVHAIIKSSTCSIGGVSKDDERLTFKHVASREAPDLQQKLRPRDCDPTATVKRDPLLFVETPGALHLHRTVDASSGGRSPSNGRCKWIKTNKDRMA